MLKFIPNVSQEAADLDLAAVPPQVLVAWAQIFVGERHLAMGRTVERFHTVFDDGPNIAASGRCEPSHYLGRHALAIAFDVRCDADTRKILEAFEHLVDRCVFVTVLPKLSAKPVDILDARLHGRRYGVIGDQLATEVGNEVHKLGVAVDLSPISLDCNVYVLIGQCHGVHNFDMPGEGRHLSASAPARAA
jgi:hypothetical protein